MPKLGECSTRFACSVLCPQCGCVFAQGIQICIFLYVVACGSANVFGTWNRSSLGEQNCAYKGATLQSEELPAYCHSEFPCIIIYTHMCLHSFNVPDAV